MNFSDYDFCVIEIVLVCMVPKGCGEPVHRNRPSHGLAFHLGGEKRYAFEDGRIFNVKENDVIYLPEHSDYVVETLQGGDCYAINFKLDTDVDFAPFVCHVKNYAKIYDLFVSAEKCFTAKKKGYALKCKSDLYSLLYAVSHELDLGYVSGKRRSIIAPAVEYIHENYCGMDKTVSYLAELCGIKETYFRQIFLQCFGISPIKYINNLKLARAKELLKGRICSVEDAARLSGFDNVYWFCRFFKRETGVTPSDFRRDCNLK